MFEAFFFFLEEGEEELTRMWRVLIAVAGLSFAGVGLSSAGSEGLVSFVLGFGFDGVLPDFAGVFLGPAIVWILDWFWGRER